MNIFTPFNWQQPNHGSEPGRGPAPAPLDDPPQEPRDVKRVALVVGLGALSWVATYVGMLELIEANMGDLPLIHKIIIGFSVAMLMTMIVWLLDRLFAPAPLITKASYLAGYIFLSAISVGFGFGFYWKVLESRGEASRSAESAITQVQTSLFGAATRLEQLQSTLDQLTTLSSEKSEVERTTGRSCPNSGPGDGPRRKMREEDAQRFKFASDFVKGRVTTVKSDMAALDADLQKIVKDDRSVIDAKTGTRNDFLRSVGRKLDLTVTGFNAFRGDPQLKQIRIDLADRAEKSTVTGAKGNQISCPDAQLQMALRGVVRAIDQLPELEKPKIAAVEGSEATIEAFRRLTTTLFGVLTFRLPPSADELRELQKRAVQSVELQGGGGAPGAARTAALDQSAGLAKRDYVPLAVAIFVDLCLLLVSIGRPMNRFVGMQAAIREAERGPVYPILSRFYDIHTDERRVKIFEMFRDVIFDLNGQYHVAVPLNVPRHAPDRFELKREAQNLANVCYALEGKGILVRPWGFLPTLLARRELTKRGSKFIECYADAQRLGTTRSKPSFKVYRFRKGAWQEMILGAVMGAARHAESERANLRAAGHALADPDLPLAGETPAWAPVAPETYGAYRAAPARPREPEPVWPGEAVSPADAAAYGAYARFRPQRAASPRDEPHADLGAFGVPDGARREPHFADDGLHAPQPRPESHPEPQPERHPFAAAADAALGAPLMPAADVIDEAANNNTEPLRRADDARAEVEAAAPDEVIATFETLADAPADRGADAALELPAPESVDEPLTPAADTSRPRDEIDVDEISGWFSRPRRQG